jgi:hypothetical protein
MVGLVLGLTQGSKFPLRFLRRNEVGVGHLPNLKQLLLTPHRRRTILRLRPGRSEIKVRFPVTVPPNCGVTVAVKVTDCPNFDGFSEEASAVVVAALFTTDAGFSPVGT